MIKFCAIALLVFASCKKVNSEKETTQEEQQEIVAFDSFGDKIKFASTIKEVCSKKGCWMKLPLNGTEEAMITFKDYGFFMPLDAKDNEVIVAGKAFIKETTVAELQHYAEDAGKSKEEIAQITAPKREYAFEANGVLMKK